jgi:hypothetical protein
MRTDVGQVNSICEARSHALIDVVAAQIAAAAREVVDG